MDVNHPMRAFIRFQAKSRLTNALTEQQTFDESLFQDVARTTFHAERHPELFVTHSSAAHVKAIEQQVATEIVETYRHIKQNQERSDVQRLNTLLS